MLSAQKPEFAKTEKRPLLVIIGRQRSGTTALRSALARSMHVADLGEIFHSTFHTGRFRYFNFVLREVATRPENLAQIYDIQIFRKYCSYLHDELSGRRVMIDVKYGALFAIRPNRPRHCLRPAIFDVFDELGVQILHVVRRNKALLLLSEMRAIATGEWGAQTQASGEAPRIPVHPDGLVGRIAEEIEIEAAVRQFIERSPSSVELCYEEIFNGEGCLRDETRLRLGDYIGTPVGAVAPRLMPNRNRWKDEIRNFDEVCASIERSPYAWMADELRDGS